MSRGTLAPFTCPDCGKTLLLVKSGSRQRCPDCACIREKQKVAEAGRRFREKKQQTLRAARKPRGPKPESNMQQIARIAAEGRALGLSYGQMAAMKNKGEA